MGDGQVRRGRRPDVEDGEREDEEGDGGTGAMAAVVEALSSEGENMSSVQGSGGCIA